ncbi:MAG: tetratricopeptide repeat protein [Magnetococcales bacterium]|nr:tetratricopeptide repeat protein [Magnetococcales bacterium]
MADMQAADLAAARELAFALCGARRFAEALVVAETALTTANDDAYLHNLALICLMELGQLERARAHGEQAVQLQPESAVAHNNLGTLHQELRGFVAAAAAFRRALELDPDYADAHYNLGRLQQDRGHLEGATACYRQVLRLLPDHVDACANLGVVLQQRGESAEAEVFYRRALATFPDHAAVLYNLGLLLQTLRRPADATAIWRRLLTLRPDDADLLYRLGVVLQEQGLTKEAEAAYQQAVAVAPGHIDACLALGTFLQEGGQPDRAEALYRRGLEVVPDAVDLRDQLGALLRRLRRFAEAEVIYREALRLQPDAVATHYNLGILYKAWQRSGLAATALRQAVARQPTHVPALYNLGVVLSEQLCLPEALTCYERILAIDPQHAQARWARAMLPLFASWESSRARARARESWREALAALRMWFAGRDWRGGEEAVGSQQPFFLAYHDADNRPLLTTYGDLCTELMATWLRDVDKSTDDPIVTDAAGRPATPASRDTAPIVEKGGKIGVEEAPTSAPPLRVGIVGKHFFDHSVWHALIRGWLQHLDRRRFHLFTFATTDIRDAVTAEAAALSTLVAGPRSLPDWVATLRATRLDVILYPEVGMDITTARLAALRLAPLQLAAWGHPESTGLTTIDGFLSAELMESAVAQKHYRERLFTLPNLGASFLAPTCVGDETVDLAQWGLASERPILISAGTPFKYDPAYDALYVAIARRLPGCQIVFFRYPEYDALQQLFATRLERAFAAAGLACGEHVFFLPWLPAATLHGLLRVATLMLDTIGFSGFNTVLRAVTCNLPVVTLEGRFLRSRLGAGVLRRLGVTDTVVTNVGDYVDCVVRLAGDAALCQSIRERLAAGAPRLFADPAPIERLQELLLAESRMVSTLDQGGNQGRTPRLSPETLLISSSRAGRTRENSARMV